MNFIEKCKSKFADIRINIIINKTQKLYESFLCGKSKDEDLDAWELYMDILEKYKESKGGKVVDIKFITLKKNLYSQYLDFLLKHYPQHEKLINIYRTNTNINNARNKLFKKMVVFLLGNSIQFLDELKTKESKELNKEIGKYVFMQGDKTVVETIKCVKTSDEYLYKLLNKIYDILQQNYKSKYKNWIDKYSNILDFKYKKEAL